MNTLHRVILHLPRNWQTNLVLSFVCIAISIVGVLARGGGEGQVRARPSVILKEAPPLQMPGVAVPERNLPHESDCNSPLHWDGSTLYVFNSYSHPWRSS